MFELFDGFFVSIKEFLAVKDQLHSYLIVGVEFIYIFIIFSESLSTPTTILIWRWLFQINHNLWSCRGRSENIVFQTWVIVFIIQIIFIFTLLGFVTILFVLVFEELFVSTFGTDLAIFVVLHIDYIFYLIFFSLNNY